MRSLRRSLSALVILVAPVAASCAGSLPSESTLDVGGTEVDATLDAEAETDALEGDTTATDAIATEVAPEADAPADAGVTCPRIAHIGDSLTAYTIDPLTMAYAKVGVTAQIDAYGGRAILQKLAADPKTGKQAALDFVKAGFKGCWVVALGTNDTANVAAGATYTRATAIDEMMKAIDPTAKAPVMWVNTFTTKTTGSWSNDNMELWNDALDKARARWPNLKIYDWAAVAATGVAPYSDGIHHTTAGYATRNRAIAEAFVGFYPTK